MEQKGDARYVAMEENSSMCRNCNTLGQPCNGKLAHPERANAKVCTPAAQK